MKIFNLLSKALRKRTPDQCRSHHQKLQNKFNNNTDDIIVYIRDKIEEAVGENQDAAKGGKDIQAVRITATGTLDISEIEKGLVKQEEDTFFFIDLAEVGYW